MGAGERLPVDARQQQAADHHGEGAEQAGEDHLQAHDRRMAEEGDREGKQATTARQPTSTGLPALAWKAA